MGVTKQQMLRAAWRRAVSRAAAFAETPTLATARRLRGDLKLIFTLDKKLKKEGPTNESGHEPEPETARRVFTHYPRG